MEYKEVILNKECLDWISAIKEVSNPLLEKKFITENYIKKMIEYNIEYNAYFVIAKNIALVHARPEDGVIKNCVSLMPLNKSVNFGSLENDPVNLVICLASVDAVSHIDSLKKIMNIVNNKEIYERIMKITDKEYIINNFL